MTKNWIAINVLLLILAGLLGWHLKVSRDRFNAENDLSKVQPVKDVKQRLTIEAGVSPLQPPRQYNAGEFAVIVDKNVFSETRAREEKEAVAVVPETPPLQAKPVLVGVAIVGNQRMVSMIDPTAQATGRKSQTKRVGDVYQGYTITDITDNEMVLESGSRREVIPLHAGSKRSAQQGKTPIIATRLVNFGGGGAAGGTVPVLTASAPRPGAQPPTPASPTAGAAQRTLANQQTGARPSPAQTMPQPAGALNPAEGTNSQGQRIIRTPFGDYVAH